MISSLIRGLPALFPRWSCVESEPALTLNLLGLIGDDQFDFGTNVLSVDALGQKSA